MVKWQYLEGSAKYVGGVLAVSFCQMYADKYQLDFLKIYSLIELGELGWNLIVCHLVADKYRLIFKCSA